jgi:hypothetical protein
VCNKYNGETMAREQKEKDIHNDNDWSKGKIIIRVTKSVLCTHLYFARK